MPTLRTQLDVAWSDTLPKDVTTNVVYHTISDSIFTPATDYDNHAQQVLDCFTGNAANYAGVPNVYKTAKVTATVYDLADAKPRPERAVKTNGSGPFDSEAGRGPGQVALVMSFYASRNLPTTRGRIYLGPFASSDVTAPRPTAALLASVLILGHALFDVGGEDVAWVCHSEKLGSTAPVTDIWCDNSWDTQRRRKRAATLRQTLHP